MRDLGPELDLEPVLDLELGQDLELEPVLDLELGQDLELVRERDLGRTPNERSPRVSQHGWIEVGWEVLRLGSRGWEVEENR